MAGDNQMDPERARVDRSARSLRGEVDYAKANRLFTGRAWELIPRHRYLGNAVLSLLTKIASGYWHVADSQAGYTAISLDDPRAARPRPRLHPLRLPERPARPPERDQRARARRPVAADLQRRRAVRDQAPEGRAADLLAADEGLLLADAGEVRHPRLPPARLLLRARDRDDGRRAWRSASPRRCCASWATASRPRRSSSSPCSSSRASSSRCSRCGSTWSRTRTCAEEVGPSRCGTPSGVGTAVSAAIAREARQGRVVLAGRTTDGV